MSEKILLINDHPPYTGVGKYWVELYNHLAGQLPKDWQRYGLMQNMGLQYSPPDSDISVQYRPRFLRQEGYGKWYTLDSFYLYPRKIPGNFSLYHLSSQMMGRSIHYASPGIVTCHDLIVYESAKELTHLKKWIQKRHLKAILQASGIIFISEYSKKTFQRYFDYPEERMVVIHHAAGSHFTPMDKLKCREELDLPEKRPIIISVGSEAPRKNINILLEILWQLRKKIPLILLIRIGNERTPTRTYITDKGLTGNVIYREHVSEEDLAKYYNAADLFLSPSRYEGFGMPVLEAMQSGVPVIASNATSIPEITGAAAILHDPMDIHGFVTDAKRILTDAELSRKISDACRKRALGFTWEEAARQTVGFYQLILDIERNVQHTP